MSVALTSYSRQPRRILHTHKHPGDSGGTTGGPL
ncbi:hypothetical protein LAW37_17390 [Escherichia coli]|nr:hypothetical protein [Escherichia coli]MDD8959393.1 hypothetical protein [Escherichia coli]